MEGVNKCISALVLALALAILYLRSETPEENLKLETVISSLLKYERKHVEKTSPKIAIGFGACKDLFVTRSHMMDGVSFPKNVDNYLGVGDREEFVSMLGYFFQAGAAAERFVHDDGLWSQLLNTAQVWSSKLSNSRIVIGRHPYNSLFIFVYVYGADLVLDI